jgi:hypothetical protein
VCIFSGLAFPFLLRVNSEWEDVYLRAANHLRAGESIYSTQEGYVYPPFMAAVALPFTYVSPFLARLAWYLINVGCVALLCRWAWRLSGGAHLEGRGAVTSRSEHWICWLGLACGIRYAIDGITHQQCDLVIATFVFGGCCALLHSRSFLAASCIGLAAAAKCTPLLWCGYLLWRRRWLAAIWLAAVAVAVSLLPDLVHRPVSGGVWLGKWITHYLVPLTRSDDYPGGWHSEVVYNQSLAGAANRWCTTAWTWKNDGFNLHNVPRSWSPVLVRNLLYGTEIALLVIGLMVLGWRSKDHTNKRHPTGMSREIWEYSVVLLLMLLLSPMSSKPHFCTLLLPGFCLARSAVAGRDFFAGAFLVAGIAAGAVGIKGLLGPDTASVAMWYGNLMWCSLILFVGCSYELVRYPWVKSDHAVLPSVQKAA